MMIEKLSNMKPIFIIQMPAGTPPKMLEKAYEQIQSKDIGEDYHVLFTIGNDTTATFKCFNSPYTQEEYDKLELLIKEIQEDYEQRN